MTKISFPPTEQLSTSNDYVGHGVSNYCSIFMISTMMAKKSVLTLKRVELPEEKMVVVTSMKKQKITTSGTTSSNATSNTEVADSECFTNCLSHNRPCRVRFISGRLFYECAMPKGKQCCLFESCWMNEGDGGGNGGIYELRRSESLSLKK